MDKLASPIEGGGFKEREAKVPVHEFANMGAPLIENTGGGFTIKMAIGPTPKNIIKFSRIPTIPIEIRIPELDSESYSVDGWDHVSISIDINNGMVALRIIGKFGRNDHDFLWINGSFARTANGETADDSMVITNTAGVDSTISLFDIMQIRLKSGDPKYARFSDQYPTLDVEGVMAMVTRYLKDFTRLALEAERAQAAQAAAIVNQQPDGGIS
jgi:hypothetical protein